ncbi:Amidohydrolase family [Acididesulfobacillus acetoxydans]|uniref:Amidohydrolase n=1 Tax=Acididesulfobacillus acetoxydans TaxID=1561005 RepID=A0A8S0XAS4_9FIRM|nr:amidohydrolase [Acididesulfobacillus acetoxydans]CAA7600306.1 Amidohydrolase family [Acididesulfobacillus acetoxydans]CEJ06082.1 Amidohydrolase [Acididesulfobacillus acetoxydans]
MSSLVLRDALVVDVTSGRIEEKDIWVREGKLVSAPAPGETAPGGTYIDLGGAYVLPGLIDCHTHLGIIEEATGKIGVDNNEISNPVTPGLRGIDAVNPVDIAFQDAVKSGITTVMSGPGSDNVVGGQSLALKTYGTIIDKMLLRHPVGLKIALGENPITTYGQDKRCPVTRMATAALVRELFLRTQDYMELKARGRIRRREMQLEAVIPVLTGEISLRAHAHRADDIVTAIRIAEEFGIKKLVIEHGTEADIVKEYLKERNIPVAFGPMLTPRIKMELRKRNYGSVVRLAEAGIKVALITDHPYNSIDQLRTIAALAVAEGLSPLEAMRSVTIHPAEILECDHRVGKIEPGLDADLVVFDGPPLDINSKVLLTMIDGTIVYRKPVNSTGARHETAR